MLEGDSPLSSPLALAEARPAHSDGVLSLHKERIATLHLFECEQRRIVKISGAYLRAVMTASMGKYFVAEVTGAFGSTTGE